MTAASPAPSSVDPVTTGIDLADLAQVVEGQLVDRRVEPLPVRIFDVVDDTRAPELSAGGALFLARGSRSTPWRDDGAIDLRATEAVSRGAVAVVADHEPPLIAEQVPVLVVGPPIDQVAGLLASEVHGRPSTKVPVALVTGTDGKTTTSTMLAAAVAHTLAGGVTRLTTVERHVAGLTTSAGLTTPEAPELQRALARGIGAGDLAAVVEASSSAAQQGRLTGVEADVAVFTNLSHDHLDQHGTLLRYFMAKVSIFDEVAVSVVNIDDAWGWILAEIMFALGRRPVLVSPAGRKTGPSKSTVDVRLVSSELHPHAGTSVEVEAEGAAIGFTVHMEGPHNVANALCALGGAIAMGLDATAAAEGISGLRAVRGRLDLIPNTRQVRAYVDYAHTPEALRAALHACSLRVDASNGKVIVVAGAGGGRDQAKRPEMGRACFEGSDLFIATSDNPRCERQEDILADLLRDVPEDPHQVLREPDRSKAIRMAVRQANPGDVILVAGKGHEEEQIEDGKRRAFSDHAQIAEAFEELA